MNALLWLRRPTAKPEPRHAAWRQALAGLLVLGMTAASEAAVDERSWQITPPRLGYLEGDVSFWRPGTEAWEPAQVNIPLAVGDGLATQDGRLELQIGGQSFLRAGEQTQLRIRSQEPDFLQVEVTAGTITVDLRELARGHVIAIDTPGGRTTLAQDGYYRVDVQPDATRVTVRRAGQATVAPTGGHAVEVATGEAVQIDGTTAGQVTTLAAAAFDDWDRWNYERADGYLAAPRSYAVSADVYGGNELEHYGTWRYVNTYGRVWVPSSVPVGWAPYTSGRWLYDPLYGWSWVDYAPWGWAPYHYGRWVYAGYWAWAPGPVLVAPVYAPALVAFFGGPSISIGIGVPFVSWVALGWGEPLIPWWGPVGFIGSPCWYGWGGPHIVNNIVINTGDTVTADAVTQYRNLHVPGGVVSVARDRFNDWDLNRARVFNVRADQLKAIPGKLPVERGGAALARGGTAAPEPSKHNALSNARREWASGTAGLTRSAPGSVDQAGKRSALADARHEWSKGTAGLTRSAPGSVDQAGKRSALADARHEWSKGTAAPDRSAPASVDQASKRNALSAARRDWSSGSANLGRSAPASGNSASSPASVQRGAEHRARYQKWTDRDAPSRAPQPKRAVQSQASPPPLPQKSGAVSRFSKRAPSYSASPRRLESSQRPSDVRRTARSPSSPPPAPQAQREVSRGTGSSAGEPARPAAPRFGAYGSPRTADASSVPSVRDFGFDRNVERAPSVSAGGMTRSIPAPSGGGGGSVGRSMGSGNAGRGPVNLTR